MLIVITAPGIVPQESEIINKLFDSGLTCLHMRKPDWDTFQIEKLIKKIHPNYHRFIKLHGAYELCECYYLGGIHLPESKREAYINNLLELPKTGVKKLELSSSFHHLDDLSSCSLKLNYGFLSPVFTSVSKRNYEGQGFKVVEAPFPIIALGGVTPEYLEKTKELGYSGVAVLGYLWNQDNPLQAFKKLNETYEKIHAPVYITGKNT